MTYTSSKAQAGRGSVLSIGGTPTEIGEVKDVPMQRGKWSMIDVTNFDSASDSEQIPTVRKPGSVTFKGNRVSSDAGQVLVEAAYQSGALTAFSASLPLQNGQTTAGDIVYYNAFVAQSNFSAETTKAIKFSIKQNITGGTTVVVGS
jgi:hypothetical protein